MDAEHRALIRKEIARRVQEDNEARERKAAIRASKENDGSTVVPIKFKSV